ncbi:MAG: RidA family protein [Oscillospiraceae bacterium]|nr:RidA family protein [Oscillospiraceae bacterium]
MLKIINTPKAPAAIGPYSQAVIYNNTLYLSGQIPIDPATGEITGNSVTEQTERIIRNISEVLKESGSDFSKVIKTTCFLRDISRFGEFNNIYSKYFIGKPARSCVEVSALPKGALVEIEVIAGIF